MRLRTLLVSLLFCAIAGAAGAQGFPEKAITMVVPFPAGGSADLIARAVAEHMTATWKQNVLVANRPGASGWYVRLTGGFAASAARMAFFAVVPQA